MLLGANPSTRDMGERRPEEKVQTSLDYFLLTRDLGFLGASPISIVRMISNHQSSKTANTTKQQPPQAFWHLCPLKSLQNSNKLRPAGEKSHSPPSTSASVDNVKQPHIPHLGLKQKHPHNWVLMKSKFSLQILTVWG